MNHDCQAVGWWEEVLDILNDLGQFVTGDATTSHGETDTPLTTAEEELVGYSPEFSAFTAHESSPAAGSLDALSDGTGLIAETLAMNLTFTFAHNPCQPDTRSAGPVTAVTLEPVKLVANLTSFPPPAQGTNPNGSPTGGAVYTLQSPISIGPAGDKPTVSAFMQLQRMNIDVGQLLV